MNHSGLSDALLEAVAMLSSVDGSVLDSNGLQEHFAMHNKRKEIENSSNANGIKKKNSSESFSNISPASDSIPMSINDDLMHSHTNDFVALNENDLKCQDVASSDKSASPILSSRQCQFAGCTKCAQGATKFCISHGGQPFVATKIFFFNSLCRWKTMYCTGMLQRCQR